ncbi:MAG TPA: hypothetical protein VG938_00870 [Verrucomicrobiae bacterium]|jgi:hypothetical protein|nr:hypothetical protein [Verrucomicrobiae bacterium]
MKKQLISKMAILSAMMIASAAAFADPILIISDGTTNTGPITLTGGSGTYINGSFSSTWDFVITTGESKPVLGSTQNPNLELDITADSLGSGSDLTIILSDNNFGPTTGNLTANFIGHPFNNGVGDAISFDTYYDVSNALAALSTPITSADGMTPDASNTYQSVKTGSIALPAGYSLTEVVTIKGSHASSYSLSANLQGTNQPPPPCLCKLSFNAPAAITNCASDTIQDIAATQDCGNGPIPVIVTPVSATTNGTCPQIITRTVSAVDACGVTHPFVQTITVNCLPNCTITPSVTTTIVGTPNLTASVANAGPGATYAWNVLNGTITAGQGTPTITWTAGTDTNSPISIIIKIVSGTGCENDCTASVKLNPQPPKISLSGGDTATIGFWHNKNGQGLILGAPTTAPLGDWLASNFPCMFGNLAGKNNAAVASLFLTDFGVKGQKTYAQVLAGALACYFTSSNLGGSSAVSKFGFNITPGGTGAKVFNVGSLGTVLGLQNNTSYTVLQLLQAANANANCSNGTFSSAIFDALNTIFDGINSTGDIS